MATLTSLPTGTWHLNPAKTTVTVTARKLGFMNIPGTLAVNSGTIVIDDNGQVSGVDVVADAVSYSSGNPKRDAHVLSDDFLDADSHPTISFHAGGAAEATGGYSSTGTITIKGQAAPIDVTISDVTVNESEGSFTATATIDRNTIGLGKLPSLVIAKELQLTVSATAAPAGAA